jgi:hypothetical protein
VSSRLPEEEREPTSSLAVVNLKERFKGLYSTWIWELKCFSLSAFVQNGSLVLILWLSYSIIDTNAEIIMDILLIVHH